MVVEDEPMITTFISKNYRGIKCASFISGIVEGILDALEFVRIL